MSEFWAAVGALAPPVGVGLVFWLVMRWIVQADRRERAAQARLEAQEDAAATTHGAPPAGATAGSAAGSPAGSPATSAGSPTGSSAGSGSVDDAIAGPVAGNDPGAGSRTGSGSDAAPGVTL